MKPSVEEVIILFLKSEVGMAFILYMIFLVSLTGWILYEVHVVDPEQYLDRKIRRIEFDSKIDDLFIDLRRFRLWSFFVGVLECTVYYFLRLKAINVIGRWDSRSLLTITTAFFGHNFIDLIIRIMDFIENIRQ